MRHIRSHIGISSLLFLCVGVALATAGDAKKAPATTTKQAKKAAPTTRAWRAPAVCQHRVALIGHRGASGHRPEHTLASYRLAIQQGAEYIEPDLVSTKDGVLIARHENEISQTTNVAKVFPKRKRSKTIDGRKVTGYFTEDFTWKEIQQLRAKERLPFRDQAYNGKYPIPSLAQILTMLQQVNKGRKRPVGIYPETKHPTYFASIGLPLEKKLVAALHRYNYHKPGGKAFIQSFEVGNLQRLRTLTTIPLIQLMWMPKTQPPDFTKGGDKRTYGDLMTPQGLKGVARYARGIGVWKGMLMPLNRERKPSKATGLTKRAHAAGLLVHVYTFRNEARYLAKDETPIAEYKRFFRLGIDGLFSDFPGTARKAWMAYRRSLAPRCNPPKRR